MDDIQKLIWNGQLNIEITLSQDLAIANLTREARQINFKIPRNAYIISYLPFILMKFESILKRKITNYDDLCNWWFSAEQQSNSELKDFTETPLMWNYPIGVSYDALSSNFTRETINKINNTSNIINVWKLTLYKTEKYPTNTILPIYTGMEEVRQQFMHQWKQACYIMHGSAKLFMSLSLQETTILWDSIVENDHEKFLKVQKKIVPVQFTRNIPLRIHTGVQVVQPVCRSDKSLKNVLKIEFNEEITRVVVQGIEISTNYNASDLYCRFYSFDGFLYVSIIKN
ncbi:related to Autophagy protein 5 [Saccharomycodes ludwigii]|uniref:Autophagy protein 5 n=1 Tax=Saccharomycodes ludwigii TaxID=36035 RepID=A0A376B1I3_9ASCO|nr:hypothetical protein SCDLUD_002147 [Saccharomycodes ludwigii]KAH3902327.1 hypothetical protein SCDLUD_002147 [Saccharomycodes ludwigii]SSD58523.1 related to Autophagy protein 5 [Saccharomycodes ludwigii]